MNNDRKSDQPDDLSLPSSDTEPAPHFGHPTNDPCASTRRRVAQRREAMADCAVSLADNPSPSNDIRPVPHFGHPTNEPCASTRRRIAQRRKVMEKSHFKIIEQMLEGPVRDFLDEHGKEIGCNEFSVSYFSSDGGDHDVCISLFNCDSEDGRRRDETKRKTTNENSERDQLSNLLSCSSIKRALRFWRSFNKKGLDADNRPAPDFGNPFDERRSPKVSEVPR